LALAVQPNCMTGRDDLAGESWIALHLLADEENVAGACACASSASTAGVPARGGPSSNVNA